MATNAVVAANTAGIATNAVGIATNANNIATNSNEIDINRTNTQLNAAAISTVSEGLQDVREGTSAIASIPDLYLGSDETWSIAGGVSLYDDGYGGSEVGFGGGIQMRGNTSDNWSMGLSGALSGDAAVVRLQARIGGN